MDNKHFTKGIGRLDAQTLNDMNRASQQVNAMPLPYEAAAWKGPFMALINPPSGIAPQELKLNNDGDPIKWGYDWTVLAPGGDPGEYETANSVSYRSTGQAGDAAVALNLAELNNSHESIMGVDTSNLPDTVKLQPVPESTHAMLWLAPTPFVPGDTTTPGAQGYVAYFYYCNQFDGSCPNDEQP